MTRRSTIRRNPRRVVGKFREISGFARRGLMPAFGLGRTGRFAQAKADLNGSQSDLIAVGERQRRSEQHAAYIGAVLASQVLDRCRRACNADARVMAGNAW